jgi:hypothetical protein
LAFGAAVVRGADDDERGALAVVDGGSASVVVGSSEVEVVGASVVVVVSGTARPTATLVDASLWPAMAVPPAASRRTTATARARTGLRALGLSVVVLIGPFASSWE